MKFKEYLDDGFKSMMKSFGKNLIDIMPKKGSKIKIRLEQGYFDPNPLADPDSETEDLYVYGKVISIKDIQGEEYFDIKLKVENADGKFKKDKGKTKLYKDIRRDDIYHS